MKGLLCGVMSGLGMLIAFTQPQEVGGVVAWTTVPGFYSDNLGGQVRVTTSGVYNHVISIDPRRAHPNASYVDVPLIVHIHSTGLISGWNVLATRYEYDATKIDIAAARRLNRDEHVPYWFSTFSGTGSQGTFTNLSIIFTTPEPLAGIIAGGQIHPDPAPNMVDFALGVANINDYVPFYNDYLPFEAGMKGIVNTAYALRSTLETRVPFTLRIYFRNIGSGNTYSPVLTQQNLAAYDSEGRIRQYLIEFRCQIAVLPRLSPPPQRIGGE